MDKYTVLKQYFGYDSFRSGQEKIIDKILAGRDVLCVMPAGAGKSICYKVPALLMEGVTLVFSSLISFMREQVRTLRAAGISASCVSTALSEEEYHEFFRGAYNGEYKIIYAAPEQIDNYMFTELTEKLKISMIAVYDAHCVSHWGEEFRPSYLMISDFIGNLSYRPVLSAFTSIATKEVRKDIVRILEMKKPFMLTTGFDRKNLYFGVMSPDDKYQTLVDLVEGYDGKSGIIYCLSQRSVDDLCYLLSEEGFSVTKYHGGLSLEENHINQCDFIYDRRRVMITTTAFGADINKPDVRFVIHYNMPQNIELYYQEAGHAGRDGEPADCILFYDGQDVYANHFLLTNERILNGLSGPEYADEIFRRDIERLKFIMFYCTTDECLRSFLMEYFGERSDISCGNCSGCIGEFELMDITLDAQKILSCIYRIHKKTDRDFGRDMTIDVLRGSKNEQLLSLGLDCISTYGIMSGTSTRKIRAELNWLIYNGYLMTTDDECPLLKLTNRSAAVLKGRVRLDMKFPKALPKADKKLDDENFYNKSELLAKLRMLRSRIAEKEEVPSYIIFTDASLKEMCRKQPTTIEKFMDISGVSEYKAEHYGKLFCKCIEKHLKKKSAENSPEENR